MHLTDSKCKTAKGKTKPYKLFDGGGLYLYVMPNGSKYWRLKYRFLSKEKLLSLGTYPLVPLIEAREEREKAKKLLQRKIDPSLERKELSRGAIYNSKLTFKAIGLEWMEIKKENWSKDYYDNISHRLETDIYPYLGDLNVGKITAPILLNALKKVENRGAFELAARCRQTCGQIFRYAIQTGRCENNPAINLIGALKTRGTSHYAAIETKDIPELLKAIEKNSARLFLRTIRAIKLSLLTFVRPGELRTAKWSEFDLEKAEWIKPGIVMKSGKDHIVPLSKQAIAILREQKDEIGHLKTDYVFPSQIDPRKPMSDGTVGKGLQRLGFKGIMTAHGFRALARTTIREELNVEPDIIEAQLAHKPASPLGAAYDRAQFLRQRRQMMQDWADYLYKFNPT